MPRSKRFIFGSGIHCPLIIRIPKMYKHLWPAKKPGMKIDRLVSFVDMPKTWLDITGSKVPGYMQGTVFLGPRTEPEQEFHFAFRGRMDERIENARTVCDKQFLYIRNYMPYTPWMQHLNYLWNMAATQAWVKQVDSGKASEIEARFFKPKGWTEEFYDMHQDPDNVDNLIDNPEYAQIIGRMRAGLRSWQEQIHDSGLLPESEMVKRAADNHTTIYEMVRNPRLYNLPALLDGGLRYWGLVGCFLLDDQPAGLQCMEDDSHEVRAMAAWLLIRTGEKKKGFQCLKNLLEENSCATLSVLNILDWLGDEAKELIPTVQSIKCTNYETRLQEYLLTKFGLISPAPGKKGARKRKAQRVTDHREKT